MNIEMDERGGKRSQESIDYMKNAPTYKQHLSLQVEEINLYELYTEEELVELPQIQISFVSPDDEITSPGIEGQALFNEKVVQ